MAASAMDIGAANAAPFDHQRRPMARHEMIVRHEMWRPIVMRERVYDTLRFHRFRGVGDPYFFHGRYVVRSFDRLGRVVLVEIDPRTGAFIGVI